jgi:hypothetical protein
MLRHTPWHGHILMGLVSKGISCVSLSSCNVLVQIWQSHVPYLDLPVPQLASSLAMVDQFGPNDIRTANCMRSISKLRYVGRTYLGLRT